MVFQSSRKSNFRLSYYFQSKEFGLYCTEMAMSTDPGNLQSNGKIISTLDLVGVQLFIKAVHPPINVNNNWFFEPYSIASVVLNFGQGREIFIPCEGLKYHRTATAEGYYEYKFPDTISSLASLFAAQIKRGDE